MSITKPTLIGTSSFDAAQQHIFTFSIQSSTSQIVANKLTIRTQEGNAIVYDERQETFKYEHILAANKLTNGTYYNATITVFNAEGEESSASVPIQFWCYTTPIIEFSNLPANNLITNSTFDFAFTYKQKEGEALNSYVVNLYNAFHSLISTSEESYVVNGVPPYTGNYLFAGFEDNTTYYIEIIASTINGAVVTTGQVQITVKYSRPDLFTLIELKNNCDEGYITLKSNIILIEGESNPSPPEYIDGKEVDLTNPDSWVEWHEGYSITGDFLTRLWFRNPNANSQILKFSNAQGQTITLNYMQGYENVNSQDIESYVEIYVKSVDGLEYYIYSNFIPTLADTEYYNVWLTRENNLYKLQLAKV